MQGNDNACLHLKVTARSALKIMHKQQTIEADKRPDKVVAKLPLQHRLHPASLWGISIGNSLQCVSVLASSTSSTILK